MNLTLDTFTGSAFVLSGLMVLWRELLLSPRTRTFPCAPLVVRIAMFVQGTGSVLFGALFFTAYHHPPLAGEAALPLSMVAGFVALYHLVFLANIFRERRPKKVWDARRRIDAQRGFTARR